MKNLNEKQKFAVEKTLDNDYILIAGAGAGKTTVLAERVAYILKNGYAAPHEILVLTYTKKAAAEMTERIIKRTGVSRKNFTVGTFHSVCTKILRKYGFIIQIPSFSFLSSYHQRGIIMDFLKVNNFKVEVEISDILAFIDTQKNNLIPPHVAMSKLSKEKERLSSYILAERLLMCKAYDYYQSYCWKNLSFDFSDILVYTYVLLSNCEDLRDDLRQKYRYIITDESQDNNFVQMSILKELNGNNNIMCIGDWRQSIYAFRGAYPKFILENEKNLPGSKVCYLTQNYRSTKAIVLTANTLIAHSKEGERVDMESFAEEGEKPHYHIFNNGDEEAKFVIEEIKRLTSEEYELSDIFILYSKRSLKGKVMKALRDEKIPYVCTDETNFWSKKEIADIICFIKLLYDNTDENSFIKVLNQFFTKQEAKDFKAEAERANVDFLTALTCSSNQALTYMHSILIEKEPLINKINKIIEVMGFVKKLESKPTESSTRKLQNIEEFLNIVSSSDFSVEDLVDYIELSDRVSSDEKQNVVNLMTIHASKGLEAKVVFLVGFEDGNIPDSRAYEDEAYEEQRRLLYVAITRAVKRLYLLTCIKRNIVYKNGNSEDKRFLKSPFEREIINTINKFM